MSCIFITAPGCAMHFPPEVVIEPTYRHNSNPPEFALTSYPRRLFDPVASPPAAATIPATAVADVPVQP